MLVVFSAVKLHVRDLGGHLDVTQRGLAGTLKDRFEEATSQVIAVGALPSNDPNKCLGLCSEILLAGLTFFTVARVLLSLSVSELLQLGVPKSGGGRKKKTE